MEDLPAELTINILSRLPVKTIFHCKCVCKKWRNLLLESSFVDLHLSRSPTALLIHHKPTTIGSNVSNNPGISTSWSAFNDLGILEWVEIEDKDDYRHLHHDPLMSLALNLASILQKSEIILVGSVNGLICLWQHHPNLDNTYICNPVTREYMILPRQKYYGTNAMRIVYGFGVSSMTGEYKVIRTLQSYISQSSVSEAEVYTLGTGQWRSVGHVPYDFYGSNGSFMNDHCHWIAYDEEDTPEKVCTFDLDTETFQLFPSPPVETIQGSKYHYVSLAILKGCLCIMDTYDSQFTIWVMMEYGIKESWHKEVVIKQDIHPHIDWPFWGPIYLIEGLKDGSILTLCDYKLWALYPNNKTFEDTGLFKFSSPFVSGLAYRSSFLKLHNFELERVRTF